jgi:hypothetical protein
MSTLVTDDIQELVREYVASEIVCQSIEGERSRVACVMPLQYADGDSIVIWVELSGDHFRVSDYGEAFLAAAGRKPRDLTDLFDEAATLSRPWGVEVRSGSLVVRAHRDTLGDAVWRTATAAALVAQRATTFRPPRRGPDRDQFTEEVERELRAHDVPIRREVKLEGRSGHVHRATLYVPTAEAILEPIEAPGHYNQISSVYTKFGDLSRADGYRRLSLIDDRHRTLSEDLAAILVQVSDVVRWTRRTEWLQDLR